MRWTGFLGRGACLVSHIYQDFLHFAEFKSYGSEADCFTPTLPAFVHDLDSPAPSPPAFPLDFNTDGEAGALVTSVGPVSFDGPFYFQSYSSYSSLDGWDGVDIYPSKCIPGGYNTASTIVVAPQSPSGYNHDSIMKGAIEAAALEVKAIHTSAGVAYPWNYTTNLLSVNSFVSGQQNIWF